MKKLLLFLFSFIYFSSFAQLDREHWFAPMFDGQSNQSGFEQYLHLSTNEITPFIARVYSNNILIAQETISKGNPGVIEISRNYIITNNTFDLHKVGTKGLYIKADRPCFANFRFEVTNHAEIITSKGTAGIGTKFYTVVAPNTQNSTNLGFTASFIATEDNTTVTVNNFKKPLTFNNYGAATGFTFTLNKGQSYIIDGRSSNINNRDGFIGATVIANKPISMTNGNFNGQHASTSEPGSDILMDQSVPTDKLGDEFVIVKGYGAMGNNMEGAVIVATEPNTSIYLNDSTTPAITLSNPGDFYKVSETNYISRGSSGHYNLHIKTDKNVYVYQLLGGVEYGSSPLATGGMNYIPPLNCYLPKKIDEISYVNYMSDQPHFPDFTTKLNIITEKGAVVKVNGVVPNAQYGPYDISNIAANQKWVTYSILGVTGNITVESTKAVTAGIASGNAAFGYGGYFAGFSAIPLILKTEGDCLPGVKLEITEGFDSYEWLIKDALGAYIPAAGVNNTNTYEPTQAGIYAVKVKQGSCDEIQTHDFKFYNCTTFTNYDYTTCTEQTVTPIFALSTQSVNIATLKIDTPPTKGTVVINPDGTLSYKANLNATGTDTFKFSFCGNGTLPDCETVQATINLNQIEHYDKVLNACSLNGIGTYNLSLAEVSPDTTVTKVYYETLNGAENQIASEVISNFTNLTTADRFVWVRLVNSYGCIAIAKIELKSKLAAEVKPELYIKTHCDEDIDGVIDGIYKVDATTITPFVLQTPADHVVRYYDTQRKANEGLADNITGVFSFPSNTSIWIRVEPKNGCPEVIKEIFLKTGINLTINIPADVTICDNNLDNTKNINLANYTNLFTTDATVTIKYFATLANAQNNTAAIPTAQTITGDKTFYYRFSKRGVCDAIGTLNIIFKAATPSTELPPTVTVCEGATTPLYVGTGYTDVLWSTGSDATTINVGVGTYWVDLTNASGCVYRQNVSVVESQKPKWNIAAYNATICDDNFDGIIPVKFSTITPVIIQNAALFTVEYSLSPTFVPLLPNDWSYSANTTVYVRTISPYCPTETKTIDFKIGNQLPLINDTVSFTVCDNDVNNTENINLAAYRSLFTADATATVKYFATLANAQNNTAAIPTAQTITGDKTFYYRFSKAGVCDAIGTLNLLFKAATPSTELPPTVTVCEGATTPLYVGTGYTDVLWSTGSDATTINVGVGNYWVDLTNASGCVYRQNVSVVESPKPKWNIAAYNATICDDNFDGIIPVKLSTITPIIIQNAALFTVEYSLSPTFLPLLPNDWSYSANTTVYVRTISPYCPTETKTIDFKIGDQLPLINPLHLDSECDDDFDATKSVNLSDYISKFTTATGVTTTYFKTLSDAQKNTGSIPSQVTITDSGTYYLRFHKNGICDNIGTLTLTIKIPKKSEILVDKSICPQTITNLDAGPGFSNYLWSTGETSSSINVPIGDYWVELTFDGCKYKQNVSVKTVSLPQITGVEIQGGTVTIMVSGGNTPYQYSIDGTNYQSSNIFNNVPAGDHTIYVISADQCLPVTTDINILRILNVITPNDDGKNDVLNYSDLLRKDNPFLQIFDRFGVSVFKGDKNNSFSWNGKSAGKTVPTGSYWYVLQWQEPGSQTVSKLTGWVLVKTRE